MPDRKEECHDCGNMVHETSKQSEHKPACYHAQPTLLQDLIDLQDSCEARGVVEDYEDDWDQGRASAFQELAQDIANILHSFQQESGK